MSDEKTCPYCEKKLRRDNTRGACSDCLNAGKPVPEGAVDELAEPKRKGGKAKASDTMKSFRVVATALGKDPDAILEEAADAWLQLVRNAVKD